MIKITSDFDLDSLEQTILGSLSRGPLDASRFERDFTRIPAGLIGWTIYNLIDKGSLVAYIVGQTRHERTMLCLPSQFPANSTILGVACSSKIKLDFGLTSYQEKMNQAIRGGTRLDPAQLEAEAANAAAYREQFIQKHRVIVDDALHEWKSIVNGTREAIDHRLSSNRGLSDDQRKAAREAESLFLAQKRENMVEHALRSSHLYSGRDVDQALLDELLPPLENPAGLLG